MTLLQKSTKSSNDCTWRGYNTNTTFHTMETAGIAVGDVLVAVYGMPVADMTTAWMKWYIELGVQWGTIVEITVLHSG